MGQLCCFPFSQAEEKISKCLLLQSPSVGVCLVKGTVCMCYEPIIHSCMCASPDGA